MPYYLAERVLIIKPIASPAEATGEYIELVAAPPGTAGAIATRGHTTESIFQEVIVRGSVADCVGDYHYAYDADSGGPPSGGASYLLRWYGAGVADQTIKNDGLNDSQPMQFPEEGMLDGQMTAVRGDRANTYVVSSRLVCDGDGYTGSAFGWTGAFGVLTEGRAFVLKRNDSSSGYSSIQEGGTNGISRNIVTRPSNPRVRWQFNGDCTIDHTGARDLMWLQGGFNASGEPVGGSNGAAVFDMDGTWTLLYIGTADNLNGTDTMNYVPMYAGSTGNRMEVDYCFVPDADLSSMLVPVVMDTFNRADGPLGDADVGGAWTAYNNPGTAPAIETNQFKMYGGGTTGDNRPHYIQSYSEPDVVVRATASNGSLNQGWSAGGFVLRWVDANNLLMVTGGVASTEIRETIAGIRNTLASTATGYGGSDIPLVAIADGDAATAVHNDTTVVTYSPVSILTSAGLGLNFQRDSSDYVYVDNFSVYPRRSQQQYDDAIQPFIDGLGSVAPSNPAKPKYLVALSAKDLPDQTISTTDEIFEFDAATGLLAGQMEMRVGSDARNIDVVNGKYKPGPGGGYMHVRETESQGSIDRREHGRTIICTGIEENTYTRSVEPGFHAAYTSNPNARKYAYYRYSRVYYVKGTSGIFADLGLDDALKDVAVVAGGYDVAGEPSTDKFGYHYFRKVPGGQWVLDYFNAGDEGFTDQRGVIGQGMRFTNSSNTDSAFESLVTPYDPLPQLLTPVVQDTFNRADGALGNAETGQAWTISNGTMSISGNKVASGGAGTNVANIDAGITDYVIRVVGNRALTTESTQLRGRFFDAANSVYVDAYNGEVRIAELVGGSININVTSSITEVLGADYPLVAIFDGDTVTGIHNDTDVVTLPGVTAQTAATKLGFSLHNAGATADNFQVLPRRSYSQYDEVLDSYVPGYVEPPLVISEDFESGTNNQNLTGNALPVSDVGSVWSYTYIEDFYRYSTHAQPSTEGSTLGGLATGLDINWRPITFNTGRYDNIRADFDWLASGTTVGVCILQDSTTPNDQHKSVLIQFHNLTELRVYDKGVLLRTWTVPAMTNQTWGHGVMVVQGGRVSVTITHPEIAGRLEYSFARTPASVETHFGYFSYNRSGVGIIDNIKIYDLS